MRSVPGIAIVASFLVLIASTRACAHDRPLRGLVLGTVPARGEAIVRYDATIAAPAGVTTLRVPAAEQGALRAGTAFNATVDDTRTPWTLVSLRVTGAQSVIGAPPGAEPGVPAGVPDVHRVHVGEYAPAGAYVDQLARPFTLHALRGTAAVVGFFYTRAPSGSAAAALTAEFADLQRRFDGYPVRLVEVSLDPAYDVPAVLAAYATAHGVRADRWLLAGGAPKPVLDAAAQFDETAFPDERVGLVYTQRLVLIDQDGEVRDLIGGAARTPGEIVAEMHHVVHDAASPTERIDLWLSTVAVAVFGPAAGAFSGFTDVLGVVFVVGGFVLIFWLVGRAIARGTT